MKIYQTLLILIASTVLLSSCEKSKDELFAAALDRIEPELAIANSPGEKITILEAFAKQYEGYPQITDIRKQIDRLKEEKIAAKKAKSKQPVKKNLGERIAEGNIEAMREFIVAAAVLQSGKTGASIKDIQFTAFGKSLTFKQEVEFIPTKFRLAVNAQMRDFERSWAGCTVPCQNEKANALLKPILSGALFDKDGKIHPSSLTKLMPLLDAENYGGLTKKEVLALYRSSLEKTLAARNAIRKDGDKKALKTFRSKEKEEETTPGTYLEWYYTHAKNSPSFQELKYSDHKKGKLFGFWMRRLNDGTADIIETAIQSFIGKE